MDLGLEGRVAVVAASSKGLGRASAEALAGEGARLVISARHKEALENTEASLRSRGAEVVSLCADVTDEATPERLVSLALEQYGRLDVVVANAGGPPPARALDVDDEAILAAVQANLLTSVRLVRACLPHMREAAWGRICCIASSTITEANPTLALSNTARTGLWAWAKTAAADLPRQRDHPQPRLSRLPRHGPHDRARHGRQRAAHGRPGGLRQGGGLLVLGGGGQPERHQGRRRRWGVAGALSEAVLPHEGGCRPGSLR